MQFSSTTSIEEGNSMSNKIAVQLRKSHTTAHLFERLKYCKSCNQYTVLIEDNCKVCGAQQSFISVNQYTASMSKRLFQAETFIVLAVWGLSLVAARNWTECVIALAAGAVLFALYFYLHHHYKTYIHKYRMQLVLDRQFPDISKGIELNINEAVADIQHHRLKDAYEKLREVGLFIHHDRIKIRKIMCLNTFFIRKDMELELETLIPSQYDSDFILYLWEVSKVNKQLIRQSALDYVVRHQAQIEELRNGKEILTNVVGAALRMKPYVLTYQALIMDYADELPKDRFLRLCHILATSPKAEWMQLTDTCKEITRVRYAFDPDFQNIW
ncbi:hypothetical protein D3C73_663530 [compost metagenome]